MGLYTCLYCDYPYLVSLLFAVLLSLSCYIFNGIYCLCKFLELRVVTTQQQNSVLTGSIIISGISYTGSIGGKIADPSIYSNTGSNLLWMDDKACSHCLKTRDIHRAKHSKAWIILHSFIYSGIFIFMIFISRGRQILATIRK